MPIQIGPEHAASAMAGSPMTLAANAGTQPQKRTDRVQVKSIIAFSVDVVVVVCDVFMQVFVYV